MRRWMVVLLFAGVATATFGVAPARGGGMTIWDDFCPRRLAYGWGPYVRLTTDERSDVTFDRPGIYPYACSIHPGMTGAVVVLGRSSGGATYRTRCRT
jgi:hypothetical protein